VSAQYGHVAAAGPLPSGDPGCWPVGVAGSVSGTVSGAVPGSASGVVSGAGLGVVADTVSAVAADLPFIRDAASVWALLRDRLAVEEVEVFAAVYLNGRNRVLACSEISRGTVSSTLVHPREVFRPAIALGASCLILGHNHPSGDPTPSAEDHALTRRLRDVGELLGVRVLDHVVITASRYVSLAETGQW
jgi:DNA repair protein RadC